MQSSIQKTLGLGLAFAMTLTLTGCNSQNQTKKVKTQTAQEATGFENWIVTDSKQTKQAISSSRGQSSWFTQVDSDILSESDLSNAINQIHNTNRDLNSKIDRGDISVENGRAIDAEVKANKMKLAELQHVLAFKFTLARQVKEMNENGKHDENLLEQLEYSFNFLKKNTEDQIAANVAMGSVIDKTMSTTKGAVNLVLAAQRSINKIQNKFLTDKLSRYQVDYNHLSSPL